MSSAFQPRPPRYLGVQQRSVDTRSVACAGDAKVGMSAEQLAINEVCGNALAEANLVGGQTVMVRGAVVESVTKIGTAFAP